MMTIRTTILLFLLSMPIFASKEVMSIYSGLNTKTILKEDTYGVKISPRPFLLPNILYNKTTREESVGGTFKIADNLLGGKLEIGAIYYKTAEKETKEEGASPIADISFTIEKGTDLILTATKPYLRAKVEWIMSDVFYFYGEATRDRDNKKNYYLLGVGIKAY